jgi:hypothetical protein
MKLRHTFLHNNIIARKVMAVKVFTRFHAAGPFHTGPAAPAAAQHVVVPGAVVELQLAEGSDLGPALPGQMLIVPTSHFW